jgi:hypothetical protein
LHVGIWFGFLLTQMSMGRTTSVKGTRAIYFDGCFFGSTNNLVPISTIRDGYRLLIYRHEFYDYSPDSRPTSKLSTMTKTQYNKTKLTIIPMFGPPGSTRVGCSRASKC